MKLFAIETGDNAVIDIKVAMDVGTFLPGGGTEIAVPNRLDFTASQHFSPLV